MADKDIREDIEAPEEVPPSDGSRSEGGPATRDPERSVDTDDAPPPSALVSEHDGPLRDAASPEHDAVSSPVDRPAADARSQRAPDVGEADAAATAASPVDPEPNPDLWRAAIADALADAPPAGPLPSAEGRAAEALAADGASVVATERDTLSDEAASDEPSAGETDRALFTTAAQDLFRPPDIEAEPHLITLGRRFDPSASVSRPVLPDIAPRAEPVAAPRSWWAAIPWGARLRTVVRYVAYAAGGYLALVLMLIPLFRFVNPPGSMLMLTQVLTGTEIDRTWVPLGSISRNLVRAVIVSEDGRFCEHSGIDTAAIREAIERASRGTPRGASTISMQVIKNLFLWNAKSYVRKVIEIPLTLYMELVWPKSRILEVYLNIAEWGPGVFGAEAAARHHFGKPAARLGEREAALLAAVLPNPVLRNAGAPSQLTSAKARVVQSRVRAYGAVASCVASQSAAPPAAVPAGVGPSRTLRKAAPPKAAPAKAAPSKAAAPKPQARKKAPPVDDWAPTLNFGPP